MENYPEDDKKRKAFWKSQLMSARQFMKPFIEAGFVVMTPMFRGENGNPGHFEWWMGDIDDAAAAARWLAQRPYVTSDRVYGLGWSYGGVVALLLSLRDDTPLRLTGAIGGPVDTSFFGDPFNDPLIPFDRTNPEELQLRVPLGNLRWMQHEAYVYVGSVPIYDSDAESVEAALREVERWPDTPLEIIALPGEYSTPEFFRAAVSMFFEVVQNDMRGIVVR